jgi:hypothetical protein
VLQTFLERGAEMIAKVETEYSSRQEKSYRRTPSFTRTKMTWRQIPKMTVVEFLNGTISLSIVSAFIKPRHRRRAREMHDAVGEFLVSDIH